MKKLLWSYAILMAIITLPVNFIGILVGPVTLLCFLAPLYIVFNHLISILKSRTVIEKIYLISMRGNFFWNGCLVSVAVSSLIIPLFHEYYFENSPYINVNHNPFMKYQSILTNVMLLGLGFNYYIVDRLKGQVLKELSHRAEHRGRILFDSLAFYQYTKCLFEKGYVEDLLKDSSKDVLERILNEYNRAGLV